MPPYEHTVFFPIKDTPPPRGPKFLFRTPPSF
jgi:hypothetical protein